MIAVKIKDGCRPPICRRTGTIFGHAQLDHLGNISGKLKKNLTCGFGGDAITRLLQF